jgi:hypothetical protein
MLMLTRSDYSESFSLSAYMLTPPTLKKRTF